MEYTVLPLDTDGESSTDFTLDKAVLTFVTRFNYTVGTWVLDIIDVNDKTLIAGITLVPGVNLLLPYPELRALIGALTIFELNEDDYKNPDLLGTNVQLVWYPVGMPMEFQYV